MLYVVCAKKGNCLTRSHFGCFFPDRLFVLFADYEICRMSLCCLLAWKDQRKLRCSIFCFRFSLISKFWINIILARPKFVPSVRWKSQKVYVQIVDCQNWPFANFTTKGTLKTAKRLIAPIHIKQMRYMLAVIFPASYGCFPDRDLCDRKWDLFIYFACLLGRTVTFVPSLSSKAFFDKWKKL